MWWYLILLNCYSQLLIFNKSNSTVLNGFVNIWWQIIVKITFIDNLDVKNNMDPFVCFLFYSYICFLSQLISPHTQIWFQRFRSWASIPLSQFSSPNKLYDLLKFNIIFIIYHKYSSFAGTSLLVGLDSPIAIWFLTSNSTCLDMSSLPSCQTCLQHQLPMFC